MCLPFIDTTVVCTFDGYSASPEIGNVLLSLKVMKEAKRYFSTL